jgi:ABC-type polysaccharide/polyol phosphate export permease
MPNINWKLVYQHSFTAALALVFEVIAMDILKFENPFIFLLSGIGLYFFTRDCAVSLDKIRRVD